VSYSPLPTGRATATNGLLKVENNDQRSSKNADEWT